MTRSNSPLDALSCTDTDTSDSRLSADACQMYLSAITGWDIIEGHRIQKRFECRDFLSALALTNAFGGIAEEEGHHPDLTVGWGKVVVDLWTHSADGLSEYDFIVAAKIDAIAQKLHPQFMESVKD